MNIQFRLLDKARLQQIVPLLYQLNEGRITTELLSQRVSEMATQSYDCIGIMDGDDLIGICGLWFQTRHYAGKSVEIDHVFVDPAYRDQGIGTRLMEFVYDLAAQRSCRWVELNTYVENFPSHRFYYRHGFVGRGLHFIKDLELS